MNEQEIQALLQKQQNGTISPDEHRRLSEAMKAYGYQVDGLNYADIASNMQDPLNLLPQGNDMLLDRGTYGGDGAPQNPQYSGNYFQLSDPSIQLSPPTPPTTRGPVSTPGNELWQTGYEPVESIPGVLLPNSDMMANINQGGVESTNITGAPPTQREQISPIYTSGIEQNSKVTSSFDNMEFGAIPQAPRVLTKEEEDETKRKAMDNRGDNYNRYGLDRSAYLLGRSIKGGESATTGVAAGLNIGLNLARNIGSGMGHANLETEAEKERRKQQPLFGPRIMREGGSIPMPFEQELTGAYVQGGSPNDQNPEIANVEGGEFLMQEDGQIQEAVGPSHEDGGIPLTRDEVPQAADVLSDDLEIGKEFAKEMKEVYPKIRFHFKDTYAKAYDKVEDNLGVKELIDAQEKINEDIIYQEENIDSDTADLNIEELFLQLEENQAKLNQLEVLRQAAFENIYSMQEESKGESPEMEEGLDELEAILQQGEEMMGDPSMMDEQMMMDPNMMGMEAPPMDMGDGMQMGMLPPPQDEMEMEMAPLMRKGGKVLSKANNKGFYSYRDVNGNIRYRSASNDEGVHKQAQQSDSYRIVPEGRAPKIMAEGGNTEAHPTTPYTLKSKKVEGSDVEVQYVEDVGQYYRDNFIPVRGIDQHNGLDLQHMHDKNMPIPSISAGTVKEVHDNTSSAGYYVIIENDEGQTLRYLHLSDKPNLKVGQRVLPGDIIGNMGNTGEVYSTTGGDGTHLHIDIDRNKSGKKQKDPLEALSKLIGEPIVSDLNKWQQAAIFARDQASNLGITVNEYYNTLKTRPEVDINIFNDEILRGVPMEEAIVNVPETPEIDYNRTQSATEVGFGSVVNDNVNERLTNLYREFPQALSNPMFEELFDIENGNVTLRDGVNLSESINKIKQLQQGIENSYGATAEYIENDDTGLFTETQKEQAREFIAANRFDGTSKRGIEGKFGDFSSTRQTVRYDRLSPETREKLNDAGIYNLNQVNETVLENLDIDETEKQDLIAASSNLPEGVSMLLADRPEEQIGENAEPAEVPQAPGDTTATTGDTGVDATVVDTGAETTTTEEDGTIFQPYFEPPPAGVQAPQRHTFRMGRMSPEHLNVDQQLAEVAREESFALETLDRLPPAERAEFAADVRLSAQNARNQLLTQAEMTNMQSRGAAQGTNLQLDAQEQQTNIQLDQDYEQKIFQTQNVADESRRNYYRFLNDADWQARQDSFNMRMVNQAQSNYYTDAQGNIRLRSTGEVVQMTPQQIREYQQNVAKSK